MLNHAKRRAGIHFRESEAMSRSITRWLCLSLQRHNEFSGRAHVKMSIRFEDVTKRALDFVSH